MLIFFVGLYLIISLCIGIYASKKIKSSGDFILAGKKLPVLIATATVFATWFGSETIIGSSSEIAEHSLLQVIEDPFGASLCLILIGLFFAKPLYKMNLITFGDFYKITFGRKSELISAFCLIASYLGWVAAQMLAIGIILNTISHNLLSVETGIIISSLIIIVYTLFGGMWAVAYTDTFQMVLIIIGLTICTIVVYCDLGGIDKVLSSFNPDKFSFLPETTFSGWMNYIAAWITIGLGSIPQQDVFQRVMSSDSEKTAVRSSLYGAFLYLTVALLPLLLGLAAKYENITTNDSQLLLPELILLKTNILIQVLFFGALTAAILSTASGALLAPSVILSENILRPLLKNKSDQYFLKVTRWCVIIIGIISLIMALLSDKIYELVADASAISMVSLFVPLCFGLFLKSKNEPAAIASMLSGFIGWFLFSIFESFIPPIISGTLISFFAYVFALLFFRKQPV